MIKINGIGSWWELRQGEKLGQRNREIEHREWWVRTGVGLYPEMESNPQRLVFTLPQVGRPHLVTAFGTT